MDCLFLFFISLVNFCLQFILLIFLFAGFQFDYIFDWTILRYQQSQMANGPPRALVRLAQQFYLDHACYLLTFQLFFALQGGGAGPSVGMSPAVANVDRQLGNLQLYN